MMMMMMMMTMMMMMMVMIKEKTYANVSGWKSGWHNLCCKFGTNEREENNVFEVVKQLGQHLRRTINMEFYKQ